MPLEEAEKLGAQALFGEKYGEFVRVVDMDFSIELCGGCHVRRTGEIGKFAILGLESKGSGIYRITAATEGISEKLEDVLSGTNKELPISG